MAAALRGASHYLENNKFSKAIADSPKFRDEGLKIVETTAEIVDSLMRMPFVGASRESKHFTENVYSWTQIARGGSGIWFNGFVGAKNALREGDKTIELYDMAKARGIDNWDEPLNFDNHDYDSKIEWQLGLTSRSFKTASQVLFSAAFGVCQLIRLPGLIDKLRDRGQYDALKYPPGLKAVGEAFNPVMMGRAYLSAGGTLADMVREGIHYNNGGRYYNRQFPEGIDDETERLRAFVDRMIINICGFLDSSFKGTVYLFKVAHLEVVHPVFAVLGIIFNTLSVVFGGIKTVRAL